MSGKKVYASRCTNLVGAAEGGRGGGEYSFPCGAQHATPRAAQCAAVAGALSTGDGDAGGVATLACVCAARSVSSSSCWNLLRKK